MVYIYIYIYQTPDLPPWRPLCYIQDLADLQYLRCRQDHADPKYTLDLQNIEDLQDLEDLHDLEDPERS